MSHFWYKHSELDSLHLRSLEHWPLHDCHECSLGQGIPTNFYFFSISSHRNSRSDSVCLSICMSISLWYYWILCRVIKNIFLWNKDWVHPPRLEYVWGFDPESFSFRGSSCLTLNQLGYISLFNKLLQITTKFAFLALKWAQKVTLSFICPSVLSICLSVMLLNSSLNFHACCL